MSKYFKERESIKLSEFLEKDISDREDYWTRAMIDSIDDFELPEDIIKKFVSFLYYGGKYDVSREIETVKGLYDFYKKFPKISDEVFYKIAKRYIKDLFEDYSLDEIFEKMIKTYGETDDTIEIFIMYVDKKAEELDKKYEEKATKLDQYEEEYGGYITYLKQLVTKEHISVDKIIKSMPEPELIKRDEEQLGGLSRRHRCDITVYPSTYYYTRTLAKQGDLKGCLERPIYTISVGGKKVEATFTKTEFLESVKRRQKTKKLIK